MLIGLGQSQSDIDYVIGLYAQHGQPHDASFEWVQKHASSITEGQRTREQVAAHFAEYFKADVAETVGVPSVTDVVNGTGFQLPGFLTGEMIAGIPNWLLIGGGLAVVMMMGKGRR